MVHSSCANPHHQLLMLPLPLSPASGSSITLILILSRTGTDTDTHTHAHQCTGGGSRLHLCFCCSCKVSGLLTSTLPPLNSFLSSFRAHGIQSGTAGSLIAAADCLRRLQSRLERLVGAGAVYASQYPLYPVSSVLKGQRNHVCARLTLASSISAKLVHLHRHARRRLGRPASLHKPRAVHMSVSAVAAAAAPLFVISQPAKPLSLSSSAPASAAFGRRAPSEFSLGESPQDRHSHNS